MEEEKKGKKKRKAQENRGKEKGDRERESVLEGQID